MFVGINQSAETMLSPVLDPATGGHFRLRRMRATEALREAIADCAAHTLSRDGITVLLDAGDRKLTIHVVPLPKAKVAPRQGAVAALFISDPDSPPSLPPGALVQRFGVTPTELRVALALVDGKSPAAIAADQCVSLATVRTHLRRLYDKTGTDGQAALVRTIVKTLQTV